MPGVHLHFADRFFAAQEGKRVVRIRPGIVRLHFVDRRQIRIVHRQVAAFGDGPDAFVAIRGQHVALGHFLLHDFEIRHERFRRIPFCDKAPIVRAIRQGRAASINVIAIDRVIP